MGLMARTNPVITIKEHPETQSSFHKKSPQEKSYSAKIFEVGYLCATCRTPHDFDHLLKRIQELLPKCEFKLEKLPSDGETEFSIQQADSFSQWRVRRDNPLLEMFFPYIRLALEQSFNINFKEKISEALSPPFSPIEVGVIKCLMAGLSNHQIAKKLLISDRAVKYHVASLMIQLDAVNRYHLVARILNRYVPLF